MQSLIILLGILIWVYAGWRFLTTARAPAGAEGAADPEHTLMNVLVVVAGFVLVCLGAIMSLGMR
jgi:uncharacterized membrane protein YidH (DUF202 family)